MELLNNIFFFVVAVGILVAFHEYGHFWVARKSGVKVLRFSIGFGKILWSYQKDPSSTQYVVSAIPLGGYVKMVDEREGIVAEEDLPLSFNRQSLKVRSAIVAAGPIFNLILAVFLFWCVAVLGETGMRPVIGEVEEGSLSAQAGLQNGEEILKINDKDIPSWSEALSHLFSVAMEGEDEIALLIKTTDESEQIKTIFTSPEDRESPEVFFDRLGLKPWSPSLRPVIGKIIPDGAADKAGLQAGDLIINADSVAVNDWSSWVRYIQSRPGQPIDVTLERDSVHVVIQLIPEAIDQDGKQIGKIGAGVEIPEGVLDDLQVSYSIAPLEAIPVAFQKTAFIAVASLKMMGKMLVGKASVDNLSGPISIAQYAGQSAELGFVYFLKYLGLISVSLGVLNLLPVPVLDGGHLLFFAIEGIKGGPIPEKIQLFFQQIGMFLLMALMFFVVILDIERVFQ